MIKKIYKKFNRFIISKFDIEIIRTHPKEAIKFAKKYFNNKKIICVEIGVFSGKNAKAMNESLNISKFYLIDPYIEYNEIHTSKKLPFAKVKAHKRNEFWDNTNVWIEEFSNDAINKIKEKVDFVYIDGNHNYEYVKKDLELYWDKIKSGGIISGHDIQYIGVSKAVLEFAYKKELEINFGDRRDWWIIK